MNHKVNGFKALKLRCVAKLLSSRYFVLMTDEESIIALDAVNPKSLKDILAVNAQEASLEEFESNLKDLRKEHSRVSQVLLGSTITKAPRKRAKRS